MAQHPLIDLDALREELENVARAEMSAPGAREVVRYTEGERAVVLAFLVKTTEHLAKRFEERCRQIEASIERGHFRYCGVHEAGRTYQPNEFVTAAGGLWACVRETTGRPGDSDGWRLAVKGMHR